MGLEAGNGFISGLVATNPVNATDQVAQGDDHIRLVKTALLGSFPNLGAAAVTPTAAQINAIVTVDAAGAGMVADIAAIADPGADRILGWDESANAAIAYTISTGLTTSTTNLLIDTSVVPQLAGNNVFTGNNTLSNTGPILSIIDTNAGADDTRWELGVASLDFFLLTRTDAGGFVEQPITITRSSGAGDITQITFAGDEVQIDGAADLNGNADISGNLTVSNSASPQITITDTTTPASWIAVCGDSFAAMGTSTNHSLAIRTNNTDQVTIGAGGTITTPNLNAQEFGFKGTPSNNQDGNYGLVLTDAGKVIYKAAGGAGETITIPANGSVAFPVGTIIRIINNGGGTLTVAITTDTLSLAGVGTTGSRTLSDHGVAVIEKVASTEWFISGAGVS